MAIIDSIRKLAEKVGADTNGRTIADQLDVINKKLDETSPGPRDIAEAVRYFADNYSGGGEVSSGSDVIFYDYDGTIVTSYSTADFANLSAMPENPTHEGLTAQGWNWTLADAKSYVAAYGKLNIGQMYITSDGKTRFYYVIPKGIRTIDLYLVLDSDTELDIDWGDGTEHTTWTSNDGSEYKRHTYSDGGRYVATITVVSGSFALLASEDDYYRTRKIELGNGVTSISDYACSYYYALTSITIPSGMTSIGEYAFYNCQALTSITIPSGVTSISENAFESCLALYSITIPNGVTTIEGSAFWGCYSLSSITIPSSLTSISNHTFYYCTALSSITIPSSVTSISESAFQDCFALPSITVSSNVTSIGTNAFCECYAATSLTFESTTPPTLGGDLQLPVACIIRVPQGTLSDYTSASNYPDPSSYIYEEY